MESSSSESDFSFTGLHTGVAWLSSARVVKCLVNSNKRAQPSSLVIIRNTLEKPPVTLIGGGGG